MLACHPHHSQGVEVVAVYCTPGFAGFAQGRVVENRAALSRQRRQKQLAFSLKEFVTEKSLPPRSHCALLVAGASCHGGRSSELTNRKGVTTERKTSLAIVIRILTPLALIFSHIPCIMKRKNAAFHTHTTFLCYANPQGGAIYGNTIDC